MRNFAKLLGIIAMVAVIGFSMTACGEEEEEVFAKFDSALYGSWNLEGRTDVVIVFMAGTGKDGFQPATGPSTHLDAKNGNTYTCGSYVFTAVVGSDGKLTISESSIDQYIPNGIYTKKVY